MDAQPGLVRQRVNQLRKRRLAAGQPKVAALAQIALGNVPRVQPVEGPRDCGGIESIPHMASASRHLPVHNRLIRWRIPTIP